MRASVVSGDGAHSVWSLLVLEWVGKRVHWRVGDGKSSVVVGFLSFLVVEARTRVGSQGGVGGFTGSLLHTLSSQGPVPNMVFCESTREVDGILKG